MLLNRFKKSCMSTQLRNLIISKNLIDLNRTGDNSFKQRKNKITKTLANNQTNEKQLNTASTAPIAHSSYQYCIDSVNKYDHENYLSTLLIGDPMIRRNAFAIRAFNVELSQIRDHTSNQTIAQMRLQFWSDTIDRIYQNQSEIAANSQPIAHEIQRCYISAKLSKHWFKKLIDTRSDSTSLSSFPFNTIQELEQYCDSTISPVFYLIIESSLKQIDSELMKSSEQLVLDHIASHIGKAQGITNTLRGIRHNIKYNRCYIPSDLLVKHKTSHNDLLRLSQTQNVRDLCFEMASIANQHILTSNSLMKKVEKRQRLLFVPLLATKYYLNRLQKCDFNVFDPKLMSRQGFLPMYLWFHSKFSR